MLEEMREKLTAQVSELEALQSVYPKELIITDHGALADINEFIQKSTLNLPRRLEYSLELSVNGGTIELLINLPTNYPNDKAEVYARSSSLNRTQQLLLNEELKNIVEQREEGEPYVYTLATWLQDNGEYYLAASNQGKKLNEESEKGGLEESITFARYWIYSHHIYGKEKRRNVGDLAKDNSITGFCLAGKPGVMCIEGALEDCDYCWQKIKAMNWQKILIKLEEKEENCRDIDSIRKFNDFREIAFPTTERHNDLGQLLKYLTELNLQHAFKELFGIEGKVLDVPD